MVQIYARGGIEDEQTEPRIFTVHTDQNPRIAQSVKIRG
jgi:hypothetical protein